MAERYWSVTVSVDGENIVTIEPNMLAGHPDPSQFEDEIVTCAEQLLAFMGRRGSESMTDPILPLKMTQYQNPDDPGNGPQYHTGKTCIEPGCGNPAGTAWSPLWCHPCNVKRMDRIGAKLKRIGETWHED